MKEKPIVKDPTESEINFSINKINKSINYIENNLKEKDIDVSEEESSENLDYLENVLNEIEEDSNDREIN